MMAILTAVSVIGSLVLWAGYQAFYIPENHKPPLVSQNSYMSSERYLPQKYVQGFDTDDQGNYRPSEVVRTDDGSRTARFTNHFGSEVHASSYPQHRNLKPISALLYRGPLATEIVESTRPVYGNEEMMSRYINEPGRESSPGLNEEQTIERAYSHPFLKSNISASPLDSQVSNTSGKTDTYNTYSVTRLSDNDARYTGKDTVDQQKIATEDNHPFIGDADMSGHRQPENEVIETLSSSMADTSGHRQLEIEDISMADTSGHRQLENEDTETLTTSVAIKSVEDSLDYKTKRPFINNRINSLNVLYSLVTFVEYLESLEKGNVSNVLDSFIPPNDNEPRKEDPISNQVVKDQQSYRNGSAQFPALEISEKNNFTTENIIARSDNTVQENITKPQDTPVDARMESTKSGKGLYVIETLKHTSSLEDGKRPGDMNPSERMAAEKAKMLSKEYMENFGWQGYLLIFFIIVIVLLLVTTLILFITSYFTWRRKKHSQHSGSRANSSYKEA